MCVQVLEPQNVDPSMIQMTFLDDVVHSLLKGENIGITSRRRSRSSQNNNTAHVSINTHSRTCAHLFGPKSTWYFSVHQCLFFQLFSNEDTAYVETRCLDKKSCTQCFFSELSGFFCAVAQSALS